MQERLALVRRSSRRAHLGLGADRPAVPGRRRTGAADPGPAGSAVVHARAPRATGVHPARGHDRGGAVVRRIARPVVAAAPRRIEAPFFGIPELSRTRPIRPNASSRSTDLADHHPDDPFVHLRSAGWRGAAAIFALAERRLPPRARALAEQRPRAQQPRQRARHAGPPRRGARPVSRRRYAADPHNAAAYFNASQIYTQRFEYKAASEALSRASALNFDLVKTYQAPGHRGRTAAAGGPVARAADASGGRCRRCAPRAPSRRCCPPAGVSASSSRAGRSASLAVLLAIAAVWVGRRLHTEHAAARVQQLRARGVPPLRGTPPRDRAVLDLCGSRIARRERGVRARAAHAAPPWRGAALEAAAHRAGHGDPGLRPAVARQPAAADGADVHHRRRCARRGWGCVPRSASSRGCWTGARDTSLLGRRRGVAAGLRVLDARLLRGLHAARRTRRSSAAPVTRPRGGDPPRRVTAAAA